MQMLRSVPVATLQTGAVLRSPIYDPQNPKVKLLGAGLAIDPDLVSRLRKRGVDRVIVSERDLPRLHAFHPQGTGTSVRPSHRFPMARMRNQASRELDWLITMGGQTPTEEPVSIPNGKHGSYDPEAMNAICEQNERNVEFLDNLFQNLVKSESVEIQALSSVYSETLRSAIDDFDLFVCLGVNPYSTQYPFRHSLHVASVAIAIGCRLEIGDTSLKDLTLGSLLHDLGMLRCSSLVHAPRTLNDDELEEIAKHPIYTLQDLEPYLNDVPIPAQIVAYQVHERRDGSGYPSGWTGEQITILSHIAALADTFVALVADRPHRRAVHPYYAIVTLLQRVKSGRIESQVMRGLLRAVSLFPLGSYYRFSDGRLCRSIRANGDQYDRPVFEAWDGPARQSEPEIVDLLKEPELRVTEPVMK